MNILFVQEQPCIRALKYAKGLSSLEDNIHLSFAYRALTLSEFYGYGNDLFDAWFRIEDDFDTSIAKITARVRPDIVHCHNAPDTLTVSCIRSLNNACPIVHDIHDLLSLRHTTYEDGVTRNELDRMRVLEEERTAVEESDGVIAVSPVILDIVRDRYSTREKRLLFFPNYVAGEMVPARRKKKLSAGDRAIHIVYEGHLDQSRSGGHYDLFDIFCEIASLDIHLHIYPSVENELYLTLASETENIHYHGHLEPRQLLEVLTQYDFGWSGFNTSRNAEHADTILANKTFEYLASGIPVISFPHRAQKAFIEEHGTGLVVRDVSDLRDRLDPDSIRRIMDSVAERRFSFTTESVIDRLMTFYRRILTDFL